MTVKYIHKLDRITSFKHSPFMQVEPIKSINSEGLRNITCNQLKYINVIRKKKKCLPFSNNIDQKGLSIRILLINTIVRNFKAAFVTSTDIEICNSASLAECQVIVAMPIVLQYYAIDYQI